MLAPSDDALYSAPIARDLAYDGSFFVGVRTTGIFCRLTCPARKPKRDNVIFYTSAAEAERAGFRPCMRCRPYDRMRSERSIVADLRSRIAASPETRGTAAELDALGHDASTVRRAFKRAYGVTFAQSYAWNGWEWRFPAYKAERR